jgi:hypothetical protein
MDSICALKVKLRQKYDFQDGSCILLPIVFQRLLQHRAARLPFRQENGAEHVLGKSIGNVRVWDSSENRSDRAASPGHKQNNLDNNNFSLVGEFDDKEELEAWQAWQACSGDRDGEHQNRIWNVERVKAFQRAIERRTFNLFKKFHSDLDFFKYPLQVNG